MFTVCTGTHTVFTQFHKIYFIFVYRVLKLCCGIYVCLYVFFFLYVQEGSVQLLFANSLDPNFVIK